MAGRQSAPISGKFFAAGAAMLLAAAWHAGPVLASANSPEMCGGADKPSLELSRDDLDVLNVGLEIAADRVEIDQSESDGDSFLPANYLSPRAEALIRDAREKPMEGAPDRPLAETPRTDPDGQPTIKARVPGVSDGDLVRYKRHMYRRDI